MTEILEMAPADDAAQADEAGQNGAKPPERKPLGEMMLEAGLIDQSQLREALEEGARTGLRLGEVVVGHGWASEEDVGRLLAEQWGLTYVDRASIWFDADALSRLSREDAQRLEALPTRIEEGRVVVAVAEPTEHQINELRRVIGEDPMLIVVPRTALEAGLHSDLLSSRGDARAPRPVPVPVPVPDPTETPELDGSDEPEEVLLDDVDEIEAESMELPPPLPEDLAEEPPPSENGGEAGDVGGFESVAALAAQARGVADLLAAQAAAMRDEAATYTRRIEQLEAELAAEVAARDQLVAELKRHLEAAVRALESRP